MRYWPDKSIWIKAIGAPGTKNFLLHHYHELWRMISKKRTLRHFSFCREDAAYGGACCLTVSLLVIMLLLPTAVYDDEEPAGVVSVAGGKVIEEFESIGMVYDAAVPQNWIALFRRTQPSSLWKAMRRSR
jgi:hypothetical protein